MKKAIVVSLFALLLGGVSSSVLAQTTRPAETESEKSEKEKSEKNILSDLTGLQVLIIIARERNVGVSDARLLTLRSSPPVDPEFVQLCLSKITYDALVRSAYNRVAKVLATRAALEAATCKTFSTAAVQNYINSGALKPIVTAEDLANQIRKPVIGNNVTDVDNRSITPTKDNDKDKDKNKDKK